MNECIVAKGDGYFVEELLSRIQCRSIIYIAERVNPWQMSEIHKYSALIACHGVGKEQHGA